MSDDRFILHNYGSTSVCADYTDDSLVVTLFVDGREDQIALKNDEAKSFGEWLIERANQAGER